MRALSSLIHVNAPNLVLFVGEALVGNDAVDQLVKFNRRARSWKRARTSQQRSQPVSGGQCPVSPGLTYQRAFCMPACVPRLVADVALWPGAF